MYDPHEYSSRGKLPPLRGALTKSAPVDYDEPPDFLMNDSAADSTSDYSIYTPECSYEYQDAEDTAKLLRKSFQVLNPGKHPCKRNPDHGSINFVHCKHAVGLGSLYLDLRNKIEARARLEFTRESLFRIKSFVTFVQQIEHLVHQEYRTLHKMSHSNTGEIPVTKLYCVYSLCEDLRTHVGHWNSLKQRINSNKWLQPFTGKLLFEAEKIRKKLAQLLDNAIWWMEKFILIGLEVFAHGDLKNITQDMLWNVTRGLEEFNSVVATVHISKFQENSAYSKTISNSVCLSQKSCDIFNPLISNFSCFIPDIIKPLPFSQVLSVLACERAKYAALQSYHFFTSNEEFLSLISSGRLPQHQWSEDVSSHKSILYHQDTSDYYTQSGSTTSLSAAILKVGNVRAPDLSSLKSPLVDFAAKEQDFTEAFLLKVCNSTNFLRKSNPHPIKQKRRESNSQVSFSSKPPTGMDTPVLSRNDSKRKCVTWGDNADLSVRQQLTSRYMETLWTFFSCHLESMLYDLSWRDDTSYHSTCFGSIMLTNTMTLAILRQMMEHVCVKDMFPPGSVLPLLQVARKLYTAAAFTSWDTTLNMACGNMIMDKCYPCPLVNGEYSTKTGMLLRDSYQPLLSILQDLSKDLSDQGKSSVLPQQNLEMSQIIPIARRLKSTCQMAHLWCQTKTAQFLSSWSVSPFLLISQTDLKVLNDETKKALYQLHLFSSKLEAKSQTEQFVHSIILSSSSSISDLNNSLQCLSGSTIKTFSEKCRALSYSYFKENMPSGKHWRRKLTEEFPKDHNPYIENALETILEPVIDGVSKLKQPSQLSAISIATGAMCDAWISLILKEKIKFSVCGTHQLNLDFNYVNVWLNQCIRNEEVKQSVLALPVFRHLNGIIQILKKQPRKRSRSLFREPCSSDTIASDSSPLSRRSSRREEVSDIDDDADIQCVPNIQDWLDLRVHGGARAWRFPSCFSLQNGLI